MKIYLLVTLFVVIGIPLVGFIIYIILAIVTRFTDKDKKPLVSMSVQYQGKDANGNDKFDMKVLGKDPSQEGSGASPGSGSNSGKTTWVQYVGKDENGNDKFKWG